MSKLTAIGVKNAKPGRHADGKGLYLLVKPKAGRDASIAGGARSWVLRVVVNGRRRDFGLGPADLVTLGEAREKAIEGRRFARAGKDPSNEWKKARAIIPTFEVAAREYHEAVKGGWANGKHGAQWLATLVAHAFPRLGSKPVDQVDASAIQNMLAPIWLTIPETARRVRQRTFAVLDFAHSKDWRADEAPARAVSKGLPVQPGKGAHFAAMPYDELPAFMAKLRKLPSSIGRRGLEFLILTAARSGEVRGAPWVEMNTAKAQWDIPGARMKGKKPHSVALSDAALDVLLELQPLTSGAKGTLVFPGNGGKPMSDATMAKALCSAGGEGFTVHGMRSSFRDWVAEQTSFPGEWAEAALSHAISNKVEAAYLRTKYLDQRRTLMAAWAEYLNGQSNVIALVERQA